MSIQTVTTILTDADQVTTQLVAATGFARAMDAHLHVLIIVSGMDQSGLMPSALEALPVGVGLEQNEAQVQEIEKLVTDHLSKEDIRWNVETVTTPAASSTTEIVQHTRFSDLVIQQRLPQGEGHEQTRILAETILFDADTPLLLLPAETSLIAPPSKIMISWDESAAALRATRQALPLLSDRAYVHVVLVDPPKDAPDRSDPGGAFAQFLSRHGIKCEVSVCNRTDNSISATLERRAEELGCDMIVMGAYGHSRLRQAIFGGTTRDILMNAKAPVFMAH
ncbi:universal stress protein [Sulfitobacter sp. JBTF-M27]|uniref:Universal stress protein n=1 Tax=Sulfitobacter sediminilitoris TaxID=2698830 RepID=A0A6P0C9X0_9RHOB|nr:universal stress protein [Sulfitobacter sediminilitoris]NEK21906.1 universal stress protein [Sulfitobacter sediminilitoris]